MKRKKVTAIALVVVMVFQFCLFSSQGAWADQNSPAGDTVTEETSPGDQAEDIGTGEGTEETAPDVVVPSSETEDSEPADDGTADDTGISDEPDNSGQSGAEPPASDEKTAPEPAAAQTDDEAAKKDDAPGDGADCAVNGKVKAVQVQGKAAGSKAAAKEALKADTDLSDKEINDAVDDLFAAPQAGTLKAENVPRQGDGSNIESIEAKWVTEDTVDNTPENAEEDEKKAADALLYVRPSGDENQTVVLKINYALSGEHNYAPGDVTITIPAYIFKTRDGKKTGVLTIPYPEDPSSAKEFNWKQIGDTYVLTNTRNMSAATKGFIEISIEGIRPSDMVDMGVSDEFDAYIEVVTHKGNTIAARSNALKAQFDTQAEIKDVSKRATGSVQTVPADQIPASQRIEGEKEYVKVNWYVWGNIQSNTKYTLDQKDTLPVDKVVATVTKDGKTIELTEKDMQGFIIGAAGGDGTELVKAGTVSTADGTTPYYSYATAYPASLFEADVEYTFHNSIECKVTEFDPKATVTNPNVNSGEDGQKVTVKTAEATTVWSYQEPEWNNPEGHFMVVKNGNDDTAGNNRTHKASWGARPDLHLWSLGERADGWYGLYPSGINNLQKAYEKDRKDGSIRLSYTIDSVGYVMPWMFNGDAADWEEGNVPARLSRNYTNPVTMITADTGVSFGRGGDPLTLGTDYTFRSIEFAGNPYVYTGIPRNINADGSFTAMNAGDGTFEYSKDNDTANWPDITLQIQLDDEWVDWASASWKSGSLTVTPLDEDAAVSGTVVGVPAETQNFRTVVTLQNTPDDVTDNKAIQAGIDYDVRVVIDLKSSDRVMEIVNKAFGTEDAPVMTPSLSVWNNTNMKAYVLEAEDVTEDSAAIVDIDKDGYDVIRGYTADTMVYPTKSSSHSSADVDYEKGISTIHYSAKVEVRSVINDKKTYEQAIRDKVILPEEHAVWRDLLPQGVAPVMSTVRGRSGDSVTNAYTIENYKESGRTLLVVEMDLTPVAERYWSGELYYYEDAPTISFDAVYNNEYAKDYGDYLHNVISYESANDQFGTVDEYTGEPDDPGKEDHNNISTERAFADDKELAAMTGLDPDREPQEAGGEINSFVYAGTYTQLNVLSAGRASLWKEVMVNNDGWWSEGTYYGNKAANERLVYEGGQYAYRLRMQAADETICKDMIIYDSLENFRAVAGSNDDIDDGAPTWQGTLVSVDTGQLTAKGCAPVVYYSTIEDLQLSDENDPQKGNAVNMDLTNAEIWTKASEYNGDLRAVKAIAIDCSKKTDGSDFSLEPEESVMAIVNMQAPSGTDARTYISQSGVWGDSAQAYNNAYLTCTTIDTKTMQEDADNFVRKDYTKVGLKEYGIDVTKTWRDDDDRDGIRPEQVIFDLYANGKLVSGENCEVEWMKELGIQPLVLPIEELDEEGVPTGKVSWEGHFANIPYTDPAGNKINYSVRERPVEGYTASSQIKDSGYAFFNTHEPERTDVHGEKTWSGDTEEVRPEKIVVQLFANGRFVRQQTVKPDERGTWSYVFEDVYKNEKGEPIEYSVVEQPVFGSGSIDSYQPEYGEYDEQTGDLSIINVYHPYGDLKVSKQISGTTEVSAKQRFDFTFEFTRGEGDETAPVLGEFEYKILDSEGNAVEPAEGETRRLSNGDTVSITGGQSIVVAELPEYVHYSVTEAETEGFTEVGGGGSTGTIKPNTVNNVSFHNEYEAKGQINLEATKILKNQQLKRYQFRYELYEVTENEDGTTSERLIRTAANARPDSETGTVYREDGTVDYSEAVATFGAIRYTQEDHGKTFRYKIVEVNTNKPGYTYDDAVWYVDVAVTDNGDGTLSIVPTYYKDSEGSSENSEEPEGSSEAVFTNEYKANGEIVLRAWKDLQGRSLTDGEFTFELLDEKGKVIQTKSNTADGSIVFDAISYNETDIGKTYHYAVREVPGSDAAVNYDDTVFGYTVEVLDNEDGTLSTNQGFASPILSEQDCDTCGGNRYTVDDSRPYVVFGPLSLGNSEGRYFVNTSYASMAGPELHYYICSTRNTDMSTAIVSGTLYWSSGSGNTKEILEVLNVTADILSRSDSLGDIDVVMGYRNPILSDDADIVQESNVRTVLSNGGFYDLIETNNSWGTEYYLAKYPACGACKGTGKTLDITGWNTEEGELPVFVNTLKPGSLAVSKFVTDAENADPNQEFKFKVKLIGEGIPDGEMEYELSQTADPADPAGEGENGDDHSGNEPADNPSSDGAGTGADEDPVGHFSPDDIFNGTFGRYGKSCDYACSKDGVLTIWPTDGEEGYLSHEDGGFFSRSINGDPYKYRDSVKKVVVKPGVKAEGKAAENLFSGLRYCTEIDLTGLDTRGATSMNGMFWMANGGNVQPHLKSITFGENFDTSSVTSMRNMFAYAPLTSIDVSGFDTSNVTSMSSMFIGCSELTSLDLSSFDTSKVTTMDNMFCQCKKLEILDISNFDTSQASMSDFIKDWMGGKTPIKQIVLGDGFQFKGDCVLPTPSGSVYTGKWVNKDVDYGAFTPEELKTQYNTAAMPGTWVWEKKPTKYTVKFTAEESLGSMRDRTFEAAEEATLPKNGFYRFGYQFDHWDDGSGNTYLDEGTITANTYQIGDTVTLNAVFEPIDTKVNIKDGEFELTLHGNEKATFDNLPAGTAYQVWEETPDGWVLIEQSNISGMIEPLETAEAQFTNKYQPGIATAQFSGIKTLDGQPAGAGAYSFTLREERNDGGMVTILGDEGETETAFPLTVTTQEGGFIQFPVIVYDDQDVGTHEYVIEEVDADNDAIDYDTHKEKVVVTVKDNGDGTLSSEVTYDDDGIRFANRTRPGELRITKAAEGATDANKDDIFTFKVTIFNEKGLPLTDGESVYWYTTDKKGNLVSNTADAEPGREQEAAADETPLFKKSVAENNLDEQFRSAADTAAEVPFAVPAAALPNVEGYPGDDAVVSVSGTSGTVDWAIYSDGTMVFRPSDGSEGTMDSWQHQTDRYGRLVDTSPWAKYKSRIVRIKAEGKIHAGVSAPAMFHSCTNLEEADLGGFDFSKTEDMRYLFNDCNKLTAVDVSDVETPSLIKGDHLFTNCSSLQSVEFPGLQLKEGGEGCTVASLFYGCSSVEYIDISGLDMTVIASQNTRRIGNVNAYTILNIGMASMFGGYTTHYNPSNYGWDEEEVGTCESLRAIKLGPGFLFDTFAFQVNPSDWQSTIARKLVLPTPPEDITTGKWVREDGAFDAKTPRELADGYGQAWAGTWVWEIDDSKGVVRFDANGGYTTAEKIIADNAGQEVAIPDDTTTTRPGYTLKSWNTKADGSGKAYVPGTTAADVVVMKDITTLYAQWVPETAGQCEVQYYLQNRSLDGYDLAGTKMITGEPGEEVTPEVPAYANFVSPDAQTVTLSDKEGVVLKYYYDRMKYTVHFDGNGATSGQMKDQTFFMGVTAPLNADVFRKTGSIFAGWSTEPDAAQPVFTDRARVRNLTDENGGSVTLYAVWLSNEEHEQNPANGVITVSCKAGETIVIPDLPDGTSYTIEEVDLPDGWSLKEITGNNGTVHANETATATATNSYTANGEVRITAHKKLENEELQEGQFTFELLDSNGQVIQTKENGELDTAPTVTDESGDAVSNIWQNTAPVIFDPLPVEKAGTYKYRIREKKTDDQKHLLDEHVEYVTVNVTDGGHGMLTAEVVYDQDGPLFTNHMAGANLKVSKTAVGQTDPEEEFEFVLEVKDADGNPVEGPFTAVRTFTRERPVTGPVTKTKYVHTRNIDDSGNATGPFPRDRSGTTQTVTIPGAEKIHIKVWYSTGSDYYNWLAIYSKGQTPGRNNYNQASISRGKLGGGSSKDQSSARTREYNVNDDTALFYFIGQDNGTYPYYGYYAVVTGEVVETVMRMDEEITIPEDGVFRLRDGESVEIKGLPHGATYTVTEKPKNGWVQDDATGETGRLEAGETSEAAFINTRNETPYNAKGSAQIVVNKKTENGKITAEDDFTFILEDDDENVIQRKGPDKVSTPADEETGGEASDVAESTVTFDTLEYDLSDLGADRAETFTYYVYEAPGENPHIEYDKHMYVVKVDVKDTGDGTLATDVTYYKPGDNGLEEIDPPTFVNVFDTTKVTVEKVWADRDDRAGLRQDTQATVQLYKIIDGEKTPVGEPVEVGTDDGWTHTWDDLPVADGSKQIKYAAEESLPEGSPYYKEEGDPVTAKKDDSGIITITNTYQAEGTYTFAGVKTIQGREMTDGDIFTFTVQKMKDGEAAGEPIVVRNDAADGAASGKINYPVLTFKVDGKSDDLGEHTYMISENGTDISGITVDDTVYTVVLEVTDNGDGTLNVVPKEDSQDPQALDFNNPYTPDKPDEPDKPDKPDEPDKPDGGGSHSSSTSDNPPQKTRTGDPYDPTLWMLTAGVAAVLMLLMGTRSRSRKQTAGGKTGKRR